MAEIPNFNVESSNIPNISIKDWILVINLNKDKKNPKDAVTLMNQIFIFSKEILPSMENEFEFKRTGFGPYSEKVTKYVNELISEGMIKIKENGPSMSTKHGYVITEMGEKKTEHILQKLPKELKDSIEFVNNAITYMGSMGTIQYIHSLYPEYVFLKEGGDKFV